MNPRTQTKKKEMTKGRYLALPSFCHLFFHILTLQLDSSKGNAFGKACTQPDLGPKVTVRESEWREMDESKEFRTKLIQMTRDSIQRLELIHFRFR